LPKRAGIAQDWSMDILGEAGIAQDWSMDCFENGLCPFVLVAQQSPSCEHECTADRLKISCKNTILQKKFFKICICAIFVVNLQRKS